MIRGPIWVVYFVHAIRFDVRTWHRKSGRTSACESLESAMLQAFAGEYLGAANDNVF